MKQLYMIGNTHFDPVWLWRWDEAMASIRATFRSALDRMKEDPDFVYSFATPPVFEWIKKTDPALFEEIKARVAEGRWELGEAWWLQPDCYSASGESYVRQGLYGQRYMKENFGKYADCVFNIDSFGHSPMLPQILRKSGVSSYCFVRPEPRHIELKSPFFLWKSPDGSEIPTYRAFHAYRSDVQKNFEESTGEEDELIVYGVTDHGGAPTKAALAAIRENPNAHCSTIADFFKDHKTDYVVTEELLTGDFGPYSNYSKIKKLNRIAEYAVLNAERSAWLCGREDKERLSACWKDILFNQFHDILGGACIKDAYIDAENQLGRAVATANETMHFNLQFVTKDIKMLGTNPETIWNLVLWNLNGCAYDGYIEAEVQWAHEFPWYDKGICLEDENGVRYPCQIIREKSVIPRFRSRMIFKASVPSMGYKVFKLIQTEEEIVKKKINPFLIETDRLSVKFSKKGTIQSVKDKKTGKLRTGKTLFPVCYKDMGDTWCFNIEHYEEKAHTFRFEGFKIIEAGALMTEIKGTYRMGNSLLEIYYRFYRDCEYFDVRYRVNWDQKHMVLKLECDAESNTHKVAVPGGSIERGEHQADVPLGSWLRCESFSLSADSIFAYSMHKNVLGLTLLRSPIYGDLRIREIDDSLDYDIIDRGIVEGRLRFSMGVGESDFADSFQNPPTVIDECNHGGTLPPTLSYFGMEQTGATLMTLKHAEDDSSTVLRLSEDEGCAKTVTLRLRDKEFEVTLSPYEIKTLKESADGLIEVDILERNINE